MPTDIENPGGAVVEVTDERAEQLLAQPGFTLADGETSPTPEPEDSGEGAVTIRNPGGALVEVPADQAADLLAQEGFERAEPEPESPSTLPDSTPIPEPEGEGPDPEPDDDQTRIEEALDSDNFNKMRGVLADLIDESTQGMTKSEVRDGLEALLE